MEADEDGDGKLSFDEFARTVANTVCDLFYFILPYFGQKATMSLAKTCSRVIVLYYFPIPYLSPTFHVYLTPLFFSGYCKANDARRFILDVLRNARWPAYAFQSTQSILADSNRFTHTHISMTLSWQSHVWQYLTFVISSTSTLIWPPLSLPLTTYAYGIFLYSTLFCSFQKQKERLINYITGVHPRISLSLALYLASLVLKLLRQAPKKRKKKLFTHKKCVMYI